jgi:hypothetical protein
MLKVFGFRLTYKKPKLKIQAAVLLILHFNCTFHKRTIARITHEKSVNI